MTLETAVRRQHDTVETRPRRGGLKPYNVVAVVLALAAAVLSLYPLVRVLGLMFWVDGQLQLSSIVDALTLPSLPRIILNTLILVLVSGTAAVLIGSVLAWANERTDARIGFVTDTMPLAPFLLPPIAGSIGWVILLDPKAGLLNAQLRDVLGVLGIDVSNGPFDIYSWFGLLFVFSLYLVPFAFLMVTAGLRNMDAALEEQSRISGAGIFRTVRKVTLPAVAPSIGAAALLIIWTGMTLFSVPFIIGSPAKINVMSVEIVQRVKFSYPPDIGTAAVLSTVLLVAIGGVWLLQRRVLRAGRHATASGKGQRVSRIELGRWRIWVRGFMISYLVLAAVLPLLALTVVALQGYWNPEIRWSELNLDAVKKALFDDSITFAALRNSVVLSVIGGFLGIVIAAVLSLHLLKSDNAWSRFLDGVIKLPVIVPHIVLAIGFLVAFAGPPLYLAGTWTILLIAYIVTYLPQASIAADAAASQINKELPEASLVAGASDGRTFRRVQLPLMLSGLAAGWALLFVRMVGDLSSSVILAGTENNVVGFRILEIWNYGSWAQLCALSLVLTLISAFTVAVVLFLSRRLSRHTSK